MIIEATQTKQLTVDISDEEVYRIVKEKILEVYNLPNGVEIRGKNLIKVTKSVEDFTRYSGEDEVEVLRVATEVDLEACSVLWRLEKNLNE